MSAILGGLRIQRGSVGICGKLAYAPQQPWIFHDTVRQNILFGSNFDVTKYQRGLCTLKPLKYSFTDVECCTYEKIFFWRCSALLTMSVANFIGIKLILLIGLCYMQAHPRAFRSVLIGLAHFWWLHKQIAISLSIICLLQAFK